jgi:hypothetical protein
LSASVCTVSANRLLLSDIDECPAHFDDRPTMSRMPPICGKSASRTSRNGTQAHG